MSHLGSVSSRNERSPQGGPQGGLPPEDPSDPRVIERNRNRRLLAELNERHHTFKQECEAEINNMRAEFGGMRSTLMQEHEHVKHSLTQVAQEHEHVKHSLTQVAQESQAISKEKAALHAEVLNMRSEMERVKHASTEREREFQHLMVQTREQANVMGSMGSEFQKFQREHKQMIGSMNKEFQKMTGKMTEYDKSTNELKKGLNSKDDMVRLESKTGLVTNDLHRLTKQLLDRGLLNPPKPEEPPEEEAPPVGVIELDEDIFSARLMLKLGFMRAEAEAADARRQEASYDQDCSSEEEELMELSVFDNVQGLMIPEVEKGGAGYIAATAGWVFVCICTTVVQWLILAIMVTHGINSEECFSEAPSVLNWWILHSSKAFAMCITGIMMGKEIMGIINYFMVSELLEPKRSVEVVLTTLAQGALTATVVAANVFIFLGLTNPADVWTNMAALGFIANLDVEVLTVAKGGILGHPIAKSLTPLNYQLTFVSHYPSWFGYVRGVAVVVVAGFIAAFCAIVFAMPDPMCDVKA